jgi:hypothetical protein
MHKITDMKCPECKAVTWIFKVSESTYRIECSRLSCDYVDEFDYEVKVAQTRPLTQRRFSANVGRAGRPRQPRLASRLP